MARDFVTGEAISIGMFVRGALARSLERKAVMKAGFSEKVVIVTGGAGALGTAVVGLLLDMGARCSVPCRRGEDVLQRVSHRRHDGRQKRRPLQHGRNDRGTPAGLSRANWTLQRPVGDGLARRKQIG